jgi:hypothetical protein
MVISSRFEVSSFLYFIVMTSYLQLSLHWLLGQVIRLLRLGMAIEDVRVRTFVSILLSIFSTSFIKGATWHLKRGTPQFMWGDRRPS